MSVRGYIRDNSVGELNRVRKYWEKLLLSRGKEGQVSILPIPASSINEDSGHRFITDEEKATLNSINNPTIIVSEADINLELGKDYIFTGDTGVYTLPSPNSSYTGRKFSIIIKNRGTNTLTINSNGGINNIFLTSLINSISLSIGESVTIIPDSNTFNII